MYLLRQIAIQTTSYSSGGGYFNSTLTSFPQTVPVTVFRPPKNAVRVNVLWFASLTLSLVSASLAILVKQWLREYLSGDHTSPQVLLRVRHFRIPGFRAWGVFEIAAVVPLLQQICLALFLIGLCFFTADVHSDIGYTTLPIVVGWGFVVLSTVIAPVFSPRCPYKTSMIILGLIAGRKQLVNFLKWLTRDQRDRPRDQRPLKKVATRTYGYLDYDEEHAANTDHDDLSILRQVDLFETDEHLLSLMWDAVQPNIGSKPQESAKFIIQTLCNHSRQFDSSPFPDLRRLPKPAFEPAMIMLAEILDSQFKMRGGFQLPEVTQEENGEWDDNDWIWSGIRTLLSYTTNPAPELVHLALSRLLWEETQFKLLFNKLRAWTLRSQPRRMDSETFLHILGRLHPAFLLVGQGQIVSALDKLFQTYFDLEHSLIKVITSPSPPPLNMQLTPAHIQTLAPLLIDWITKWAGPERLWPIDPFVPLAWTVDLVMLSGDKWRLRDSTIELFQYLSVQSRGAMVVSLCMFDIGMEWGSMNASLEVPIKLPGCSSQAQVLFIEAVVTSDDTSMLPNSSNYPTITDMSFATLDHRNTMVSNLVAQIKGRWQDVLERGQTSEAKIRFTSIDALAPYLLLLRLLTKMREHGSSKFCTLAHQLVDSEVFTTASEALESRNFRDHYLSRAAPTAAACLNHIDFLCALLQDHSDQHPDPSRFPEKDALFPQSFIDVLKAIKTPSTK